MALNTRTYGDGLTATRLSYAVYDAQGNLLGGLGTPGGKTAEFQNRTASVELHLVKGNTYTVVFWADAADHSPYTVDWTAKKMTFKTDATIKAND